MGEEGVCATLGEECSAAELILSEKKWKGVNNDSYVCQ